MNTLYRTAHQIKAHDDNRTIEFVISTEDKDRHNSIILKDAWNIENFNKNGVVAYQHMTHSGLFSEPNPDYIIGKGEAFQEGDKLIGRVTFEPAEINELAEKIYQKVLHGTLKATSVGFRPMDGSFGDEKRGEDPNTYYFRNVDLLEFSIVNIPSNYNALKRSLDDPYQEYISKQAIAVNSAVKKGKITGFQTAKAKARYYQIF